MPQGPARTADTDEELAMQRRISAALMDEWLHSLTPAQRRAMAALRLIGRGAVRVRCGPGGGVRGRVASEDGGEEYEVEFEGGEWRCTCPDFTYHEADPEWACKHIRAVQFVARALR